MRHRKKTVKLGRSTAHRDALLANQAKAVRPLAEKMVTLGKRGDLHARRLAAGYLGQKDAVKKLFAEVAPRAATRKGGYTRIIKLGQRMSDSAPMAYIEWVDNDASGIEEAVVETAVATSEAKKSE